MANLLSIDRDYDIKSTRNIYFIAMFDTKPTFDEIGEVQIKAGYHPLGYGGPNGIKIIQKDDCWEVRFSCWASCD
jgi:hypothetical protein